MHFKIVGKLLLPKGKSSSSSNAAKRSSSNCVRWVQRDGCCHPPSPLTLNSISQPGQATIFCCCCCWRWRCRRFFILSVRANCCNEITTKFSVCCIIKKFEKLLPKPGNNQRRAATTPFPCLSSCCSSYYCRPTSYYKPAVMQRLQFLHDWQPNNPCQVRKQPRLLPLPLPPDAHNKKLVKDMPTHVPFVRSCVCVSVCALGCWNISHSGKVLPVHFLLKIFI